MLEVTWVECFFFFSNLFGSLEPFHASALCMPLLSRQLSTTVDGIMALVDGETMADTLALMYCLLVDDCMPFEVERRVVVVCLSCDSERAKVMSRGREADRAYSANHWPSRSLSLMAANALSLCMSPHSFTLAQPRVSKSRSIETHLLLSTSRWDSTHQRFKPEPAIPRQQTWHMSNQLSR